MARPSYLPDNYTLCLAGTVVVASLLPCSGVGARIFGVVTNVAIGLLFFLHGAKLSRDAALAGLTHWRLHLLILCSTFVLFPILALLLKPVFLQLVTPSLYLGLLFLSVLSSTVQSSIAFTSIARGNVPAAVCAASASTLLGILISPLLGGVIVAGAGHEGGSALGTIQGVVAQLLLPFLAGQLLQPKIGGWVRRNGSWLKSVDQGSILLIVYTAFSAAVIEGLWKQISATTLAGLLVSCAILLAIVLVCTTFASRRLGFSKEDEITIVFCGSKKSLSTGVTMVNVMFDPHTAGAIILPLMLFHQIQLMTCAVLAQRYARRSSVTGARIADARSGG